MFFLGSLGFCICPCFDLSLYILPYIKRMGETVVPLPVLGSGTSSTLQSPCCAGSVPALPACPAGWAHGVGLAAVLIHGVSDSSISAYVSLAAIQRTEWLLNPYTESIRFANQAQLFSVCNVHNQSFHLLQPLLLVQYWGHFNVLYRIYCSAVFWSAREKWTALSE